MAEIGDQARARLEFTGGDDGLLVHAQGEFDIAGLPALEPALDALLQCAAQRVVIDARDLTFIDSSGIAVLIRIANHADSIEIRHANPVIRRVIEALGLTKRLPMERP